MNVFYIGPYRQTDSWGTTSRNYLKFLSKHADVVARPIYYSSVQASAEIEPELQELESKQLEERDVIIQHGLPYNLVYDGSFNTNIAVTSVSSQINNTSWVTNLNLFDKIIVFSETEKNMLIESGVKTEIYAFGFPPNYESSFEVTQLPITSQGKTIFYATGSTESSISGLKEVLVSYLTGFSVVDNVMLIVFSEQQDLGNVIDQMKKDLGVYEKESHYPTVGVVNNTQQSIINYAHKFFQCFIDVSYGGLPDANTLKATTLNKIVMTLDNNKLYSDDYDFYVSSQEEVIQHQGPRPMKGLFSGEFTWQVPNTSSLRRKMRLAHEVHERGPETLKKNKDLVSEVGVGMITLIDKWTKESLCIQ
jgi:hypothetical protein